MLKRTALTLLMLIVATVAYADVPRPDRTPGKGSKAESIDTYLSINIDREAKEAKLIIPKSQLKALRAQLDGIDDADDQAATPSANSLSQVQTIVSGVFISLAIAFAGIWFARGRNAASNAGPMAAATVVFAFGSLATIVYGNAGPPAEARAITGKMFSPAMHVYKFGGGRIKLEVSDSESQVKLIVPDPDSKKPAE